MKTKEQIQRKLTKLTQKYWDEKTTPTNQIQLEQTINTLKWVLEDG